MCGILTILAAMAIQIRTSLDEIDPAQDYVPHLSLIHI